jgi:thiazole synthase ThiGH ThiG subunit
MRDRRYAPRSGTCCPVVTRRVADALVTLLLAHVIVHNAHDPATMAAALALAVDQDDADVEPGKRGNQRDTLAQ